AVTLPVQAELLGTDLAAGAEIVVTWSNVADPSTITVGLNSDADDLLNFSDISSDTVVAALRAFSNRVLAQVEALDVLNQQLPGFSDALGKTLALRQTFDAFVNQVESRAVESLADIEEVLETALEEATGRVITPGVDDEQFVELGYDRESSSLTFRNFDIYFGV
ncbi:MAG: hypothetical protein ABGZ17_30890, partial [Planctomycetaceae bacterium]